MAKLGAYNQREVARLVKENDIVDNNLISWERRTIIIMDNDRVLEERAVRFIPTDGEKPRFYSYGYKVRGKMKPGIEVGQFVRELEQIGYTRK